MPGERFSGLVLELKLPTDDNLLASANRLLKFEFPVHRNTAVYERLIKTNLVSARFSKKTLSELPQSCLESIYNNLWCQRFGHSTPGDSWLTLFLLVGEALEFNLEPMVRQDIQLLGAVGTPEPLHSYYYEGELLPENLRAILKQHGYRTDLMPENGSPSELYLAYLACRRLSQSLPWAAMLAEITEPGTVPRLWRLKLFWEALQKQSFYWQPLTAENWRQAALAMQALYQDPTVQQLSCQTQNPSPVKTLVLVEGETEKLLLPLFAKATGTDFCMLGIEVMPAGGKNHVEALYRHYREFLKSPICVVLDGDADEIVQILRPVVRKQDYVYQIQEGEFEDTYDLKLVIKAINENYQPYPEVTTGTFQDESIMQNAQGRVQELKSIWQSYGLGTFDKIEFAQKLAELIKPNAAPPRAMQHLLETILKVRKNAVGTIL